jgi:uncharacterized protein YajQ (UPF0234 family)
MPSFDIVSEIKLHEVTNAVDQANREVDTRFDFKGSGSKYEFNTKDTITLTSETEFQLKQMLDILQTKLIKRGIEISCLKIEEPQTSLKQAQQTISLQQGIATEFAKKITKLIKEAKVKVQAIIQGEQVRVTGKKRDELQEIIALLREQSLEQPIQFTNFRD